MKIRRADRRTFLPHQRRMYAYTKGKKQIALFCEMRLGKSMVAVRWVKHVLLKQNPDARILIMCPTSAFEGWIRELAWEGFMAGQIHWLQGTTAERYGQAQQGVPGFHLINYEAVLRLGLKFALLDWDAIIVDESSKIRNPKAGITKLLNKAYTGIPYRAVLTGLPNPESPMDYFEQMRFLHGSFLGYHNFWHFRYQMFQQQGYDWVPRGGTRDKIKAAVHQSAFVLTAKQAKIGNRYIYEPRYVDQTPEIKKYMNQVRKEFRFDTTLETKWATTREIWLARLAGGFSPDQDHPRMISDLKIKELWSLLSGELAGQQVVIWFRFNEEVRATAQFLAKRGVDTGAIMGSTTQQQRLEFQQWFRSGRIRVLLMQVHTGKGGMGLDLSPASTAVYYSNAYEYEVRAQSEKRIEHPTKHASGGLLIIDLLTRGTIDEDAYDILREKRVEATSFSRELWSRVVERYRA